MRFVMACVLGTVFTCAVSNVLAQAWKPTKNVEVVVALAPGSLQDRMGRLVQRIWQERALLGVPSSVVNRVGGNGAIAWSYLDRHAGDPHFFQIASPVMLTAHIAGLSTYHYTNFTPTALLGSQYLVIATRTESPIKSGKELVERLKRDPTSVSFGINSAGFSNLHMLIAVVARAAGVDPKKVKIVAFQGTSVMATLGGHVDVVSTVNSSILPQVEAGRMRMLGIAAPQRLGGVLADSPTWKEQGVDTVARNWVGLVGVKGMTPAQIAYWDRVLAATVASEEWKADLTKSMMETDYLNSADMTRFLAAEYVKLQAALSDLGLGK
jgi:putative tricarboxylic transport membrane protein